MNTSIRELLDPAEIVKQLDFGTKLFRIAAWSAINMQGEKVVGCGRAILIGGLRDTQGVQLHRPEAEQLCRLLRQVRSKRLAAGSGLQELGTVEGDGRITVVCDRSVHGRRALLFIDSPWHENYTVELDVERLDWLLEQLVLAFASVGWQAPQES